MKLRDVFGNLVIVVLLILPSAALSNTWYVDGANGSDSNSCESPATACATIGRALSRSLSGDSIMVAPATYPGTIVIPTSVSIVGAGAGKTIIAGSSSSQFYDAVVVIPSHSPQLSVSLSGMTITGGGSGVLNYGKLTIANSVLTRNVARGGYGGGINNAGALTINKSTISGNGAGYGGGGISCIGITYPTTALLNINNSTISGNSANSAYGVGNAAAFGGGIYAAACPTTITNSTISGNSVGDAHDSGGSIGGGIFIHATVLVNSSTISANTAPAGGGIGFYPSGTVKVTLQNSLVANNVSTYSVMNNCDDGLVISDGYNLSSDDSCNFNNTGDLNNTDPKLGPLQNNGGPTETMALQCMSPAINAGNPTGCTDGHGHLLHTDQRGDKRPGDPALTTGCDIGAYEVQFPK